MQCLPMQISRAQMALSPDTAANLFPLNGVSAASNSSVPHSFYIQKRAVVAHLVAQGIELLGKSDLLWTGSATPQTLTQIGHDLVKLRQVVAPHLDSRILGTREVQQSLTDLTALFRRHALRSPDFLEHIFAPPEIPDCAPLLQQIRLSLRLAKKHHVWQLPQ